MIELSTMELQFAKMLSQKKCEKCGINNSDIIIAARIALGWRCEPKSWEAHAAKMFANDPRVVAEIERLQAKDQPEKVDEEGPRQPKDMKFCSICHADLAPWKSFGPVYKDTVDGYFVCLRHFEEEGK